jgi:hypothetical protein
MVPPIYIHHGPAGSETISALFINMPMARKITRKLVPIMKLSREVVKLCSVLSLI